MQTLPDLDIRKGDVLTVESKDYPIKFIEVYSCGNFRGRSFFRMAGKTAKITRRVLQGADYVDQVIVEETQCLPIDPASEGTRNRYRDVLQSPTTMLETMIASDSGFYKLIVEDVLK
jgi:hypothetical protein